MFFLKKWIFQFLHYIRMKRFLIVPYLGRMSFPDFNMGIFGILRPWAFNPRGSVRWYIFFLLMYFQTRCGSSLMCYVRGKTVSDQLSPLVHTESVLYKFIRHKEKSHQPNGGRKYMCSVHRKQDKNCIAMVRSCHALPKNGVY